MLNMVAWQTDRGTLSLLSQRGNFGTWERLSASDCASDCASECASVCASASSTQSPTICQIKSSAGIFES